MKNFLDSNSNAKVDGESELSLRQMAQQEDVLANRVQGVKFILVVLSAKGMIYDLGSLRQKILLAYPDSTIFFQTSHKKNLGPAAPQKVDLVIDFTPPKQREGLFYAKKLRRSGRFVVGRNSGFFRKKIYDRVYDEILNQTEVPQEMLQRESFVQKKILNLAGVSYVQASDTPPDKGKTIALELPSLRRN